MFNYIYSLDEWVGIKSHKGISKEKSKIKCKSKKKANIKQNMKGKKSNINYVAKYRVWLGTDKEDNGNITAGTGQDTFCCMATQYYM